jgi:hypothetical protein
MDTAHTGRHREGRADEGLRTGVMLIWNDALSSPVNLAEPVLPSPIDGT